MQDAPMPDREILRDVVTVKMPFGKYKGRVIRDLPEYYLIWFNRQGFPPGKLGVLMSTMFEIKINGLEALLEGINPGNSR